MRKKGAYHLKKVALVSTPWPLYNRPSVQLGTLKAYLRSQFPQLTVQGFHWYLNVAETLGYERYGAISRRTWLAEPVYGALLFPQRKDRIKKLFERQAKTKALVGPGDFDGLCSKVKKASERLIEAVDWTGFGLAGFSMSLCQLTSSLYFIRRIKKAFPLLPIVVGGAMFSGDHAVGLLKNFPEVDFVVNGEGERPLAQLIRMLTDPKVHGDLSPISGLVTRAGMDRHSPVDFDQLAHLEALPPPDYDDYFSAVKTLAPDKGFFPTLPAEISRGCWWRSVKPSSSQDKGCAFCNLTLQWKGYRSKGASQVVSEVDYLTKRHQSLSVAFVDNLLPAKQSGKIFQGLSKLGKDLRLFGEIRAATPLPVLQAMKDAGTAEVQIGIEALSTSLLQKINKGTTAIQNLQIMKQCEELGISSVSNLVIHFPTSTVEDVNETLRALDFALPFRPLKCVDFWLGLGSPVWRNAQSFGLKAIANHPHYRALFPPHIYRSMSLIIQSYRGDLTFQKKLWRPVEMKVREWGKDYYGLRDSPAGSPLLSFRDGRDFLIIRQKRPGAAPLTHRLVGTSRAIYLFCRKHRSLKRIAAHFPTIRRRQIVAFLKMMVDKRLMFEDKGRYLSLAMGIP
jgi:ribosomal peptide maturation radical SAM protein 1